MTPQGYEDQHLDPRHGQHGNDAGIGWAYGREEDTGEEHDVEREDDRGA